MSKDKATAFILILVSLLACCMTSVRTVEATHMITVPDDFPTINEAIQNATDGDTVFIKQGMYNETLVIDKGLTLKGEDTNKTIINGNMSGTVIQILHDNVTVTGLTVTYSTTPNTPRRYYQHGIPQEWLPLTRNGWALSSGYPLDGGYFVRKTEFRLAGIHIQNAKNCHISGNKISDCGVGIWLWRASQNNITGNILVQNDYGMQVESSGNNNIIGNTFLNNGGGIWLPQPNWASGWGADGKTINNTFTENNFIGNQKAIEPQSLTNTTNYWDNGAVGNYWDLYNNTDSNQDSISDEPYQIIGEYFTGGYHQHGIWTEQVYGVDNYPLMEPFNTARMFVVYTPPTEQPPTPNLIDPTTKTLAIVAVGITIAGVTGLAVHFYFKKRQH